MATNTSLLPVPPTQPAPVSAQEVLGVPLALTDYERILDWIDQTVEHSARGYICVAAVRTVMASQEEAGLRKAVLAANLTVKTASRWSGR